MYSRMMQWGKECTVNLSGLCAPNLDGLEVLNGWAFTLKYWNCENENQTFMLLKEQWAIEETGDNIYWSIFL